MNLSDHICSKYFHVKFGECDEWAMYKVIPDCFNLVHRPCGYMPMWIAPWAPAILGKKCPKCKRKVSASKLRKARKEYKKKEKEINTKIFDDWVKDDRVKQAVSLSNKIVDI